MTVMNVKWCFKASEIFRSNKDKLNIIFCNLFVIISSISFSLDASSAFDIHFSKEYILIYICYISYSQIYIRIFVRQFSGGRIYSDIHSVIHTSPNIFGYSFCISSPLRINSDICSVKKKIFATP